MDFHDTRPNEAVTAIADRAGDFSSFGILPDDFRRAAILYRYNNGSVSLALRNEQGSSYLAGSLSRDVWNRIAPTIAESFNRRLVSKGFQPGSFPEGVGHVHLHMQFGRELWPWFFVLRMVGRSEIDTYVRSLTHNTPADLAFLWGMSQGVHWLPGWSSRNPFLDHAERRQGMAVTMEDMTCSAMLLGEVLDRGDGIRIDTYEDAMANLDQVRTKTSTDHWGFQGFGIGSEQRRVREAESSDRRARSWSVAA